RRGGGAPTCGGGGKGMARRLCGRGGRWPPTRTPRAARRRARASHAAISRSSLSRQPWISPTAKVRGDTASADMRQIRPRWRAVSHGSITSMLQPPCRVSNILQHKQPCPPHAASARMPAGRGESQGGDPMTIRTAITIASVAGTVAALDAIVPVRAGGDKVAFPDNHAAGVLFTTVDRADNKQFREFYVSAAALDAAKKGEPLPSGTVITMLQYAAKLDAQGNPEKDANGRFIKGNLIGYAVMEKRAGWGAEYPDNVRNGEWEYQAFKPDKSVNTGANLSACFNCHKPLDKQDYVYLYDKMKAAAK